MNTSRWTAAIAACALGSGMIGTVAAQAPTAVARTSGLIFDARLRIEQVDDDAFSRDAKADTFRLRLGYRTPVHSGWSALVEVEATTHFFGNAYNSSDNGRSQYPLIADPDNAELNQAYLDYAHSPATKLRIGRQRLQYDNQRYIGNVGWRQNEQSFDAVDFQHRVGSGVGLRYSYLGRVQRVFGADHPTPSQARWNLGAHVLSVSHALGPGLLTGYGHFIENRTLPLTSHRNLGLRYTAKHENAAGLGWLANAELARQDDYASGTALVDADYAWIEGGLVWRGHTIKAGWESLGGDGVYAFQTPLATLHAFNGWADRFLTTPANGLHDGYLGWSRTFGKMTANLVWHEFRSDRGSVRYGHELDASLSWAFAPHWSAMVKFAQYRASDVGFDVGKHWLSLEYVY